MSDGRLSALVAQAVLAFVGPNVSPYGEETATRLVRELRSLLSGPLFFVGIANKGTAGAVEAQPTVAF